MTKPLVARAATVAAAYFCGTALVMPADAFQKQMSWPISASDEPALVASPESAPAPLECKKEPNSTYVVMMILVAGEERISVLLPYVDRLVATCKLDEVHIWNGTWLGTPGDQKWVGTLADKPGYTVFNTDLSWLGAYWYYGGAPLRTTPTTAVGKKVPESFQPAWEGAHKDNTVLIKGDDDIVYMDVDKFDCYVRYIRENPQMFIVHANIAVNGVADYYKAAMDPDLLKRFPQLGTYPHGIEKGIFNFQDWKLDEPGYKGAESENASLEFELHQTFLQNPKRFTRKGLHGEECIVYKAPGQQNGQGRMSTNFFGSLWSNSDKIGTMVNPEGKMGATDDEWAVTALATLIPGNVECIYTQFVVSHLAWGTFEGAGYVLAQYQNLLEQEQHKWQKQAEPLASEC